MISYLNQAAASNEVRAITGGFSFLIKIRFVELTFLMLMVECAILWYGMESYRKNQSASRWCCEKGYLAFIIVATRLFTWHQ